MLQFFLNNIIKSVVCANPRAIIIHSGENDISNNIYTLNNIKKIVKEITYNSKDYVTKIIILAPQEDTIWRLKKTWKH